MKGKGLVTGMKVTLGHFLNHFRGGALTELYPEVKPQLPARSHGSFDLDIDKCIACGICANACPNNVIKLETVKDENNKKKLSGYKMTLGQCLFCGLCVEGCPKDALKFNQEFEHACYSREDCNKDFFNKK